MAVASSDAPRDSLARLRIQRDADPPRQSWGGRLLRFLVVLCLLSGVGIAVVMFGQNRSWLPSPNRLMESIRPRPEVRVATVSEETGRSADALVVATGYLQSRQQARIGARATGRIQQINVEEGARIRTHDVLAVLEHADLDASLAATKAIAARARSELLEHDVEITKAQKDFERAKQLVARKSMNAADYDQALYMRDAALAKKTSLEAALQLAEARIQEAEQMRENMFVRAPFDGTVISKDAELGESIMPGGMGEASGRGSVVTIADLDHLEVDCDVKEDYISRVSEGQLTEVAVDAVPDRRYRGSVRKIIPMGDRARATVKVRVEILDADGRLFPEMSSTVYFLSDESGSSTKQGEKRTFCPTKAITNTDSATFVWLLTDKDRTKKTNVTTGVSKDGRTEILTGLTGGEKVIVGPPEDLAEDVLVKPAL